MTILALGAVIGAGIFLIIGDTASTANNPSGVGPGVSIAIVFAALICFPVALCYAELATVYPHAGTAYIYTKNALGELPAFITGWSLYAPFGMLAIAIGWSEYLNEFLKNNNIVLTAIDVAGLSNLNYLAIAVTTIMTVVASREIKWSRILATLLFCINIGIAFIFVTLTFRHLSPQYWWPLLPTTYSGFEKVDIMLSATATLFYAYTGFETAAALAQDSVAPKKDIPYAIKVSLGVAAFMYLLVALALTGVLPPEEIEKGASLTKAVVKIGEQWAAQIIGIGIVSAFSCVLLTTLLRQSRLGYAMINDTSTTSSEYEPQPVFSLHHSTILTGGLVLAFISFGFSAQEAAQVFCLSVLFGFFMVCLDLIVLRIRKPQIERPFAAPFGKLLGFLGMFACLVLMSRLPWDVWKWFLLWIAAGVILRWIRSQVMF
jgi:APA family basic amino acid/polyamine antiporter